VQWFAGLGRLLGMRLQAGKKKNRSLVEKLETEGEIWAVLGFLAALGMTLSRDRVQ
jgi:hypothetical protein